MKDKMNWTNQETFALLWLLTAITLAIGFSLWQGFSIPIFTLLFLILPLLNLILRKDAQNLGLGKVRIGKLFTWAGINLGVLILVYAIFEPWSGAYAFLLEEATGHGATDPTFSWLRLVDGLGGWIGLFFFSGLVTIFAEELFFRGWVLNLLKPRVGSVWANVIQSALFTLPQLVVAFIMPTPMMGLVYGLVYAFGAIGLINGWVASRSGTIWPNLIAATLMNFILSILILGPA